MFSRTRTVGQAPAIASFESLETRRLFSSLSRPTDLDTSFGGGDGKVVTDFGGADDVANAVAVQADGKIVVAGETQVTVKGVKTVAFAAVRYNPDGSLDDGSAKDTTKGDSFGTAGKFTQVLGLGGGDGVTSIAIQKDGKIILAGNALKTTHGLNLPEWEFLRLNTDGSIDKSFGGSGVQSTDFSVGAAPDLRAIVLQPDGRLVAAGGVHQDWLILRLTNSGAFDSTFGTQPTGQRTIDFGGNDTATAIGLDNVGNIIVAGNAGGTGPLYNVGVARLSSDGTPDNNFGTNGKGIFEVSSAVSISSDVQALAVLPSGEIHVAYTNVEIDHTQFGGSVMFDLMGNFVGGGSNSGKTSANGLVNTQEDFLAQGGTSIDHGPERFYVAEFTGGMETDVTFGTNSDHNIASAMTVGPDGKIVQVGYTTAGGGGRNFAIARYVGTPTSTLTRITGTAFADLDGDGVKDPNEAGLPNVRVFIDFDNNGVYEDGFNTERSVLTDPSGNYTLWVFPFSYHIREVVPFQSAPTLPQATPGAYTVNAVAKQISSNTDFGNTSAIIHSAGTRIVGSVFFDFDGDGTRDVQHPTEPDLAGRAVYLDLNDNGVFDSDEPHAITDAGGNYSFTGIAPGSYTVRDVLPSGWTHTNPVSGAFDVTLAPLQTIVARFATTFADPDDTIGEANQQPGNQVKVGGSVNFSIANVTDVDMIRFTPTKGQKIGFDLDRANGSSLNSFIRLFDSTGKQLASNDDGAAPGESKSSDSYLAFTFTKAGTYYLGVSNNQNKSYDAAKGTGDAGAGSTGAYKLSLVKISSSAAVAFGEAPVSFDKNRIDGNNETELSSVLG